MKQHMMNLAVSTIVFVLFSLRLEAQEPVVTILPEKPTAGASITITYNPHAPQALLKDAKAVTAEIISITERRRCDTLAVPMSNTGKLWTAVHSINAKSCVLVLRFRAGKQIDDNGGKQWEQRVYGSSGSPVSFAHFIIAERHKEDTSRFHFELNQELKLNGSVPLILINSYILIRSLDSSTTGCQYALRWLDSTYRSRQNDPGFTEVLFSVLNHFDKNSPEDSLRKQWMQRDNQGLAVREARFEQIAPAFQDTNFYDLLSKYVADFPVPIDGGHDRRLREIYTSFHIVHLIEKDSSDEAIRFFEALPEKKDEYINNLTANLAAKHKYPERVLTYADTILARARDTVWAPGKHYSNKQSMLMLKQRDEVNGLLFRGQGLSQLGRHVEALEVLRDAFGKSDSSYEYLNEYLVRSYIANDKWDDAVQFGALCIRNETAGDSIPALLRAALRRRGGNEAALDSILTNSGNLAKEKDEDELAKSRMNLPIKPCGLVTLDDGSPVDLNSFAGKVIVLDFWATWCSPCRQAMPGFQKFFESVRNDPRIVVFSVNVSESGTKQARIKRVKDFIEQRKFTFPVLLGEDCSASFKFSGIPSVVIIDTKGLVQFKETGGPMTDGSRADLMKRIEFLLKEPK